jgi:hypothetical protein
MDVIRAGPLTPDQAAALTPDQTAALAAAARGWTLADGRPGDDLPAVARFHAHRRPSVDPQYEAARTRAEQELATRERLVAVHRAALADQDTIKRILDRRRAARTAARTAPAPAPAPTPAPARVARPSPFRRAWNWFWGLGRA